MFDIFDNRDHNANACLIFRIHRLVATDTGNTAAAAAIATAAATYTVDVAVVFTFIPSSLQLLSLRATSFYGVFFNLFLV